MATAAALGEVWQDGTGRLSGRHERCSRERCGGWKRETRVVAHSYSRVANPDAMIRHSC
jgi:hypothetical protein